MASHQNRTQVDFILIRADSIKMKRLIAEFRSA